MTDYSWKVITVLLITSFHDCLAHDTLALRYVRRLNYNISSDAFISSHVTTSTGQNLATCHLECSKIPTCISYLYKGESGECMVFSQLLDDPPLVLYDVTIFHYFIGGKDICTTMGYTFDVTVPFCYKVDELEATYHDAVSKCDDEGGRLLQIDSSEKQSAITTIAMPGTAKIIIDGEKVNGVWTFSSGITVPKLHWVIGHVPNQNCIGLIPNNGNAWQSISCTLPRKFVCEKML